MESGLPKRGGGGPLLSLRGAVFMGCAERFCERAAAVLGVRDGDAVVAGCTAVRVADTSGHPVTGVDVGAVHTHGAHTVGCARRRRGGVSVWREGSRHGGWHAEGSASSGSRCTRDGCSWHLSTALTPTGSRGPRSTRSPRTSASRARRSSLHWLVSSRCTQYQSTSLDGRAGRRDTESARCLNWPGSRASCTRSTRPIHGASSWFATSPPVGHEVRTCHGGPSTVAVRALPGARRSLRSLSLITTLLRSLVAGRTALPFDAPPEGDGRGERPETVAPRRVTATVWSLLRRLPAPLADDDEQAGGWVTSLASGSSQIGDVRGLPARLQYAREVRP